MGAGAAPPSLRKGSSIVDDGDGAVGGGAGAGGGGGRAALTDRIIGTVTANAESPEETEKARSALELAAVAHLEVCGCHAP